MGTNRIVKFLGRTTGKAERTFFCAEENNPIEIFNLSVLVAMPQAQNQVPLQEAASVSLSVGTALCSHPPSPPQFLTPALNGSRTIQTSILF